MAIKDPDRFFEPEGSTTDKHRPRRKPSGRKPYFGPEVQSAIVEWQDEPNKQIQNEVYTNQIHPAFEKLAECVVRTMKVKLTVTEDEILCDIVAHLWNVLQKFDPTKDTLAFSYFNMCARNYVLTCYRKELNVRTKKVVSIQEIGGANDKGSNVSDQVEKYIAHSDCLDAWNNEDICEDKELASERLQQMQDAVDHLRANGTDRQKEVLDSIYENKKLHDVNIPAYRDHLFNVRTVLRGMVDGDGQQKRGRQAKISRDPDAPKLYGINLKKHRSAVRAKGVTCICPNCRKTPG